MTYALLNNNFLNCVLYRLYYGIVIRNVNVTLLNWSIIVKNIFLNSERV